MTRTLAELTDVAEPAWPDIAALAAASGATVLPVDPATGGEVLLRLQVTAASYLGALALNCGGVLADNGWFRLYGGGSPGLPDLASVNGLPGEGPGFLLVGADALGGRFAIDGGGLGVAPGEVCYFGPDTLSWDGLGGGHAAFVTAVLQGALGDAFASLRWPGWEAEVAALASDEGLSVYPLPCSAEGADIGAASRRAVPLAELHALYAEVAAQVDG